MLPRRAWQLGPACTAVGCAIHAPRRTYCANHITLCKSVDRSDPYQMSGSVGIPGGAGPPRAKMAANAVTDPSQAMEVLLCFRLRTCLANSCDMKHNGTLFFPGTLRRDLLTQGPSVAGVLHQCEELACGDKALLQPHRNAGPKGSVPQHPFLQFSVGSSIRGAGVTHN